MKTLILTIFFLLGSKAFAEVPKYSALGDFVDQEMSSQANFMDDYNQVEVNVSDVNSPFYMNFISLKVAAIIGLEVPFFASFSLQPSLVLRWKRKLPEGYVKFKPTTR